MDMYGNSFKDRVDIQSTTFSDDEREYMRGLHAYKKKKKKLW